MAVTTLHLFTRELHPYEPSFTGSEEREILTEVQIDMGFGTNKGDPIYHYHSNYDSYHWMSTYGDPTWNYHVAAGQFLGVLALNLAERPLLPLNVSAYADNLWWYYEVLNKTVEASSLELELKPVYHAIKGFENIAAKLMQFAGSIDGNHDHWKLKLVNNRLKTFERGFVSQGGLPGREFYKHCMLSTHCF